MDMVIEPYHYTPACDPTDIICNGSDSEEDVSSLEAKRARYEAQARRVAQGYLPLLVTSRLRGPFNKQSGWKNPWNKGQSTGSRKHQIPHLNNSDEEVPRRKILKRSLHSQESLNENSSPGLAHGQSAGEKDGQQSGPLSHAAHSRDLKQDAPFCTGLRESVAVYTNPSLRMKQSQSRNNFAERRTVAQSSTGTAHEKDGKAWLKRSKAWERPRWDASPATSPTPRFGTEHPESIKTASTLPGPTRVKQDSSRLFPLDSHVDSLSSDSLCCGEGGSKDKSNMLGLDRSYNPTTKYTYTPLINEHAAHQSESTPVNQPYFIRKSPQPRMANALSSHLHSRAGPNVFPESLAKKGLNSREIIDSSPVVLEESTTSNREICNKPEPSHNSYEIGVDALERSTPPSGSFATEVAPSCYNLDKFQFKRVRRAPNPEQTMPFDSRGLSSNHAKPVDIILPATKPRTAQSLGRHQNGLEHSQSSKNVLPVQNVPSFEDNLQSPTDEEDWETTFEDSQCDGPRLVTPWQSPGIVLRAAGTKTAKMPVQERGRSSSSSVSDELVSNLPGIMDTLEESERARQLQDGVVSSSTTCQKLTRPRWEFTSSPQPDRDLESSFEVSYPSMIESPNPNENLPTPKGSRTDHSRLAPSGGLSHLTDQNDVSTQSANTTPHKLDSSFWSSKSGSQHEIQQDTRRRFNETKAPLLLPLPAAENALYPDAAETSESMLEPKRPNKSQESIIQENHGPRYQTTKTSTDVEDTMVDCIENRPTSAVSDNESILIIDPASMQEPSSTDSFEIADLSQDKAVTEGELFTPKTRIDTLTNQKVTVQSPWIPELTPMVVSKPDGLISAAFNCEVFTPNSTRLSLSDKSKQSQWRLAETYTPLIEIGMRPLTNLETPDRALLQEPASQTSCVKVCNMIDDNPWTFSGTQKSIKKGAKKRVSFGVAPSEEDSSAGSHIPVESSPSRRSPLGSTRQSSKKSNMAHNEPVEHVSASHLFKRLLPDKGTSQLESSPAPIHAMAEAFVSADEVARCTASTSGNNHRPEYSSYRAQRHIDSPETDENTAPDHILGYHHADSNMDFNVEDALREANDFLEDWSVDLELNRAKDREMKENSGDHGRRLSGII